MGYHLFQKLPRSWQEARSLSYRRYAEQIWHSWYIGQMVTRLTKAFLNRDADRIMKLSADLGHYVGDAHVPCTPVPTITDS